MADDEIKVGWKEVSTHASDVAEYILDLSNKNMAQGKYAGENFANVKFAMSNLEGADLRNADLRGCDFTGANLKGANLSGANLEGANLSAAQLKEANFKGASLKSAKLTDADIEDAILNDIDIDDLGRANLQELIEYLAKYYPHKLNLRLLNLRLLDLSRIDLRRVSLRGVDLRGCSLKGVKIWELDLSECIITPEQIAEAMGRIPTPEEMRRLLAPKPKQQAGKGGRGIDLSGLFIDDGKFGVLDLIGAKSLDIGEVLEAGKKILKPLAQKKNEAEPAKARTEGALDKQKIREAIEEHRRQEREAMTAQSVKEPVKEEKTEPQKKKVDSEMMYKYRSEREM